MPVEPVHDFKCKHCGLMKGPLNQWWLVRVEGAAWMFRDFAVHVLAEWDYAICSIRCLVEDAQEHADKLIKSVDATSG